MTSERAPAEMPPQIRLEGEVLYGINTIYTVSAGGMLLQCRIKGKQLKEAQRSYNPIAPGDIVEVTRDSLSRNEGMISHVAGRPDPAGAVEQEGQGAPDPGGERGHCRLRDQSFRSPVPSPFHRPAHRRRGNGRPGRPGRHEQMRPCRCPRASRKGWPTTGRMGYQVHSCSARTGDGIGELGGTAWLARPRSSSANPASGSRHF